GSSREHAPWALLDQGITCVIAPSFADIFFNNCSKNGILAIALPLEVCEALAAQAGGANSVFEIDLTAQTVTGPDGDPVSFDYDEGRKEKLLQGLDDIALTLQADTAITEFEARRRMQTPWLEAG
ncbi:MAG: 3-isopropylmalate dehydratase small subunit, partial [Pseudomonadota bacterium]